MRLFGRRTEQPAPFVRFLHIPKTAGMSLHELIVENADAPVFRIDPAPGRRIADWNASTDDERSAFAAVSGHFAWGHLAEVSRPTITLTVVRDAVRRVESMWRFAAVYEPHELHERIAAGLDLRRGIEDEVALMLNDGQTRLLSGVWGDVGFGEIDRTHLDRAVEVLRRPDVLCGLAERFDESIDLFGRELGWTVRSAPHVNATTSTPHRSDVDAETAEAVAEVNRFDRQLVRIAAEILDERLGAAR